MDTLKPSQLDILRQQIDELDRELLQLFEARMRKASEIADYKRERHLTVLDESREQKVLENCHRLANAELREPAVRFFKSLMQISRDSQAARMKAASPPGHAGENHSALTIGFQGLPGSYSEQALREYFGHQIAGVSLPSFEDVFEALAAGKIDYGVLPIENSFTGGIADVYDLLCRYGFYIIGEKGIQVDHHLLSLPGAKLEDIREIYSHPQALQQCSAFLRAHPQWNLISCTNTAVSAKTISEMGSLTKAAIAGRRAADLYGLTILRIGINNNIFNYTRFIIIGRKLEGRKESDKVSLAVAIAHEPGSLYKVLSHFAQNGLNMLKIESRPIRDKPWEYLFYIDFEGNLAHPAVSKAVRDIERDSAYYQLLGNYIADIRNFLN